MAGPRQPIDLILHKGKKHLTKKEIEERKAREVKAKSDSIEAPSYLPKKLKEEFDRIANELISIGIMSNLDCEALARFVMSEHQWQLVTKDLLKRKTINEEYFEVVKLQERVFKMARQSANDLGLTISSRCKLVVPKTEEEKPQNKFGKFAR